MNDKKIEVLETPQIINKTLIEFPCKVKIQFNEPMSSHTTFKVGGPADCWIQPSGDNFPYFCSALINNAKKENIPFFILGGGANIVVSDKGIRGFVLDTTAWKGQMTANEELVFRSGTSMDEAAEYAAKEGLSGLEFLAGMPGTIGGAVWMNARCYGSEISGLLTNVELIDFSSSSVSSVVINQQPLSTNKKDFGYKLSPFQKMDCLILTASFKLKPADKTQIKTAMEKNRQDRKTKGHYDFPCAGSAFKNNRNFGKPTGQIIDELGLRGMKIGGAQIAPFHGNIIINTGNATAGEICALINKVEGIVREKTGFTLEPEILFVGE